MKSLDCYQRSCVRNLRKNTLLLNLYQESNNYWSRIQFILARTFLSLLGKLSAAADLIVLDRLHLQVLQMCLLSVWRPHILTFDHQVPINSMICFHLKWWMNTNRFIQGIFICSSDPKAFLFTDASHYES